MPRYIELAQYLSAEELEAAYRTAQDGVARSQWQILRLLRSGKRTAEVAAVTGYGLDWIRKLVRRYNAQGPGGIGDKRHQNPGRAPLLSAEQQAALNQALEQAEEQGQGWNSVQVAAWLSTQLGYTVRVERGRDWLYRLGFSTKSPRTRHAKADAEAQELFKKSLS
jgi:transposase